VALACLLAAVMIGGASCSTSSKPPSESPQPGAPNQVQDRGAVALAAARVQIEPVAPDAVAIMVGSAGVALKPPPEEWQVLFASRSTGRTYSVHVSGDKADEPRDMGGLKFSADALANVIPYETLKVGSDEAYAKAKAELGKQGKVPPQAMQVVTLVEIPSLPQYKPVVWQVSFLNGTSTKGMRQAEVDAITGTVTTTK
jgi:hypothetical protein